MHIGGQWLDLWDEEEFLSSCSSKRRIISSISDSS